MYNNINGQGNDQHQGYIPEGIPQQEPVRVVRKKNSAAKVIAMIAAVAIIGGGAGFGGAFLSSLNMRNNAMVQQDSGKDNGTSSKDNSANNTSQSGESRPTLNDLQSGITITHNVNTEAEFNSDGSFKYTRDLVSAVRDSIVYVTVYADPATVGGFGYGYGGNGKDNEPVMYGAGSGIIISSDGYILTNAHVVDDMVKYVVSVYTTDPTTGTGVSEDYDAVVVGSDTDTDLAVLKIEAKGLQAAVLGDSDQLHLGDDVVIIGNPLGLNTSVSKGIVSGLNRELGSGDWSLPSIQTDAPINSGNSGGAMFNMYGEVVGVVNEKLVTQYAENLGFAITINEAKEVINDLISLGYVTGRPILGVTCLQVSEYVAAIRGMIPGLYITEIDRSLAVAKSDLVVGDTIVKVEGISVTSVNEVSEVLADNKMRPGDTVTVTVVRTDTLGRDTEIELEIELSEYNGN